MNRKDNEILVTELRHFYTDDETFTAQDGFNLAFILYSDHGELNDTIGTFSLHSQEWATVDGIFTANRIEYDFHTCTREELGLDGESSGFYPIIESQAENLEGLSSSMLCLDDPDQVLIYGDYSSN